MQYSHRGRSPHKLNGECVSSTPRGYGLVTGVGSSNLCCRSRPVSVCLPGCITGIANVYFRNHTVFIHLRKTKKTFKNTPLPKNERPPLAKAYCISGLIQQLSCGLRLARSLHNASAPSVRADFHFGGVIFRGILGCLRPLWLESEFRATLFGSPCCRWGSLSAGHQNPENRRTPHP